VSFRGPARYRIVIQGVLSPDWSDLLAGLAISTVSEEGCKPRTALVGWLRDQAELNGVLEALYEMHLPIIEVEKLEDEAQCASSGRS
jgi:hypothetical protein